MRQSIVHAHVINHLSQVTIIEAIIFYYKFNTRLTIPPLNGKTVGGYNSLFSPLLVTEVVRHNPGEYLSVY